MAQTKEQTKKYRAGKSCLHVLASTKMVDEIAKRAKGHRLSRNLLIKVVLENWLEKDWPLYFGLGKKFNI